MKFDPSRFDKKLRNAQRLFVVSNVLFLLLAVSAIVYSCHSAKTYEQVVFKTLNIFVCYLITVYLVSKQYGQKKEDLLLMRKLEEDLYFWQSCKEFEKSFVENEKKR